MTQETPLEHSDLVGGSTASRRINCPGSYKREKIAPKSKGSSYAREGTALHEMIAQVLDQGKLPADMLPFTHNQPAKHGEEAWSFTVTEELWDDLGQPALDMFDAFLDRLEHETGASANFMIEESAEFPGIPGAFGTSDVPFRCGEIGGIWDWKFGRGEVKAEDNSQLLFYFRAVLAKYPKFFEGVTRVVLCISQPMVNDKEPDTWETTLDDVMLFEEDLKAAIELAKGDDAPIEKGPWCKFADCKAVCELHISAATRLGEKMATLEAAKTGKVEVDMSRFLADAMELADLAESWAKHIAAVAQERLEGGLPVDGWKVVPKRSSGRDWADTLTEEQVINRLRSRGLTADQYYKKTLVSPPQAEKHLKKLGKELPPDAVVQKASSGYTLTRDGDPRPAAEPVHQKAAALGSALLRQLGVQEHE